MSRVRIVRNRHGSARAACEKWLAGSLCGKPIQLGPDSFHVYGVWTRRWRTVDIEFQSNLIIILRKDRGP